MDERYWRPGSIVYLSCLCAFRLKVKIKLIALRCTKRLLTSWHQAYKNWKISCISTTLQSMNSALRWRSCAMKRGGKISFQKLTCWQWESVSICLPYWAPWKTWKHVWTTIMRFIKGRSSLNWGDASYLFFHKLHHIFRYFPNVCFPLQLRNFSPSHKLLIKN